MYRAVIIDDNAEARQTLADDIARYCPEISLMGEGESVASGLAVIKRLKPELVFLDVQLEDGTGFDILKTIGKHDFEVIFTTGSEDFAFKAIKFSAVDYLLKPVDPDELQAAVAKLKKDDRPDMQNFQVLMENLKSMNNKDRRIALSSADRVHVVSVHDIIRCESQRNYTLFYLNGNKQILVTRTLKEFDDMLSDMNFIRVHHSHLINLNYLKEFVKLDGGYALMSDNSKVPVAVRKKDDLLKHLGV